MASDTHRFFSTLQLTRHSAQIISNALVSVTFCRNSLSIIILFGLDPWIEGMGFRGMFIVITCLSVSLFIVTVPMIWYGKRSRQASAARYRDIANRQAGVRGF